jgi:secreted trypsin-like serine protease
MPDKSTMQDTVSYQLHLDPRFLKNQEELRRKSLGGTRILNGTPVKRGEYLECVAVGSEGQWACTGTLIGPKTVLTAGHCSECATRIFIGENVRKPGRIVGVAKQVRHPDYRKRGHENDLTVLILEEAVDDVTPRRLALSALIDRAIDGRAVGFGTIDAKGVFGYGIKRQVDVPIASSACRGKSGRTPDAKCYGCDPGLELVAGRPQLERDSCCGDSGGPFYIPDASGEWLLAGATSRATRSATHTCGDGGIYVRVDAYRDWIVSIPGAELV